MGRAREELACSVSLKRARSSFELRANDVGQSGGIDAREKE